MSEVIGIAGLFFMAVIAAVKIYTMYLDKVALRQVKLYLMKHGYSYLSHKEYSAHNVVYFEAGGQKLSSKYRLRLFEKDVSWLGGEPSAKVQG